MRIADIKKMENHEIIFNLVNVYSMAIANYNLNRGTAQLEKQLEALLEEVAKRNILTEDEIKYLRS